MEQSFDPYRKWLGIPPDEQPPDHYRLLGIARFEDDPDVISGAADRQMAHVRTFQTGRRSAESQRILNELSTARLSLLGDGKKEEYDNALRLANPPSPPTGAAHAAPPLTTVVSARAPVMAGPVVAKTVASVGASPRISTKQTRGRRKSSSSQYIIAAIGGGLLLLGLLFASSNLSNPDLAENNPASDSTRKNKNKSKKPNRKSSTTSDKLRAGGTHKSNAPSRTNPSRKREPIRRPSRSGGRDPIVSTPERHDRVIPETDPFQETAPEKAATDDDNSPISDPFNPDATNKQEHNSDDPSQPPQRARMPMPNSKALAVAVAEVKKEFGESLDRASFPGDRARIAAQIFEQAKQITDDEPIRRFALLDVAIRIYMQIVKVDQFLAVIDYTETLYDIDGMELKRRSLEKASQNASLPEQHESIFRRSRPLAHKAITAEKIEHAEAFARLCKVSAAKSKKNNDRTAATKLTREVVDAKNLLKAVARSRDTLAEQPENPSANAILGRYYCFTKQDWKQGLPMLVKGNSPRYRGLAEKDLSNPTDPELCIETAEGWEALANRKSDPHQRAYFLRALYWYRAAIDNQTDANEKQILRAKIAELKILAGSR